MNKKASKEETLLQHCRELELSCSLWMAAGAAKDERISQLEAECNQLRQRLARVSRLVSHRSGTAEPRQLRHAR